MNYYILIVAILDDDFRKTMEAILANVLSIIGEDTRAKVLMYLMDGRCYTARELALLTNNSPQGMSNHLKKLLDARLIKVEVQGRNRYFQLDRPEVAYAVEGLMHLIPGQVLTRNKPDNGDIAFARTCYNHLAGYLGVILCESFLEQGLIIRDDKKITVTPFGSEWFLRNGFKLAKTSLKIQVCSHACLDWTERRFHIGGALGADLLNHFLENGFFRKKSSERTLVLTSYGEKAFRSLAVHVYK